MRKNNGINLPPLFYSRAERSAQVVIITDVVTLTNPPRWEESAKVVFIRRFV